MGPAKSFVQGTFRERFSNKENFSKISLSVLVPRSERVAQFVNTIPPYSHRVFQAVKRDPTNAAYRNNLAAALTKIGDFNAAKAACEKVRLGFDLARISAFNIILFSPYLHVSTARFVLLVLLSPPTHRCVTGLGA